MKWLWPKTPRAWFVSIALGIITATVLANTASASAATPSVSMFSAKAQGARDMRAYAKYRMERGGAFDDFDGTTEYVWDDYQAERPSCSRVRRNVVDCKLRVTLWESDYDDPDTYTAKEDCRWTIRYRRARGGALSGYQLFEGGGSGGDFGSVECLGWYGEQDADDDDYDADDDYDY